MTVEFCTAAYQKAHRRHPQGVRVWAFDVASEWRQPLLRTPRKMSFRGAKAWAIRAVHDMPELAAKSRVELAVVVEQAPT